VCLENVVFRDGTAHAFVDFDFAAPGSRSWDLACLARMCVPLDAPEFAARSGWVDGDPFRRLGLVADAYGLPPDRSLLIESLRTQTANGGGFVRRRVDAGDAAFTAMWVATGGAERYDRRRDWFEEHRQRFIDSVHTGPTAGTGWDSR
jgi:thiamine kinase-like enzyme